MDPCNFYQHCFVVLTRRYKLQIEGRECTRSSHLQDSIANFSFMTFLPFSLFLSVTKLSCFLFRFHNARRLFAFPCYPLDLSLSLHHALSLLFSPGGLSQVICLYYSAAKKKGRRSSERESHYLYKVLHTHPSVGGSRVTR